jgi:small subunit ribosomal protein S6
MNLYEHTIVARQDTSPAQVKQLTEKYSKIVEKNEGEIVQTEDWGLLNLAYIIKKNKKGIYMHFKIKGPGKIIDELEKNEAIDKNLLRYMTVRVKKFNLEAKYFSKKDEYEKKNIKKNIIETNYAIKKKSRK